MRAPFCMPSLLPTPMPAQGFDFEQPDGRQLSSNGSVISGHACAMLTED